MLGGSTISDLNIEILIKFIRFLLQHYLVVWVSRLIMITELETGYSY